MRTSALLITLIFAGVSAFVPSTTKRSSSLTARKALWRHFVPRQDTESITTVDKPIFMNGILAFFVTAALSLPANAVSGGGLDYAGLDLTGQDFSNGNYKGKDFTQTIAKGTQFMNSNLQGCRFYKAFLVRLLYVIKRVVMVLCILSGCVIHHDVIIIICMHARGISNSS